MKGTLPTLATSELDTAGLLAAFAAAISWAFTGIFIRYLHDFSAATIIAGRCLFALAGATLLLPMGKRKLSFADIFNSSPAWILSLLMVTYYILAVIAFQRAPVGEVSIIMSTSPLFALLYRRIQGWSISPSEGSGALIAILGVPLVAASGAHSSGFHPTMLNRLSGDGLAFIGSAVMAAYSISYRNINNRKAPSSRAVVFLTFLIGTVVLGLWLIFHGEAKVAIEHAGNAHNILLFTGLGLGTTVLPTLCFSFASQKLTSLLATSIRLLSPLLSAILAIVILHEVPTWIFWPGTILILGGLYLIMSTKTNIPEN